jgi:excisionase family DNA binding protein
MTVAEVATELKIARKSVYRLLSRGVLRSLPHLRVKRIPRSELDKLIASATGEVLR